MRPNIEKIRENWIPALRSGDFKQGQFALKHKNEFCCLGVLCAVDPRVTFVSVDDFNETRTYDVYDDTLDYEIAVVEDGYHEMLILPRSLSQDYGLHDGTSITLPNGVFADDVQSFMAVARGNLSRYCSTSTVESDSIEIHLTSMNDDEITFAQIADILEEVCALWETAESAENKGG